MGLLSVAGQSPTASFIRVPRQHGRHESGANRGPLEKIAFQGLNVCGWSHRGPLAVRTFTPLGQGSTLTTSTNGQKAALWGIRSLMKNAATN